MCSSEWNHHYLWQSQMGCDIFCAWLVFCRSVSSRILEPYWPLVPKSFNGNRWTGEVLQYAEDSDIQNWEQQQERKWMTEPRFWLICFVHFTCLLTLGGILKKYMKLMQAWTEYRNSGRLGPGHISDINTVDAMRCPYRWLENKSFILEKQQQYHSEEILGKKWCDLFSSISIYQPGLWSIISKPAVNKWPIRWLTRMLLRDPINFCNCKSMFVFFFMLLWRSVSLPVRRGGAHRGVSKDSRGPRQRHLRGPPPLKKKIASLISFCSYRIYR